MEVTIKLEEMIPNAANIDLDGFKKSPDIAEKIVNQTVYNSSNMVHSTGSHNTISISVENGNTESLKDQLAASGIKDEFAEELSELISSEKPEDTNGLGKKTADWLGQKLSLGTDIGLKDGIPAAIGIAKEAAKQYWGL